MSTNTYPAWGADPALQSVLAGAVAQRVVLGYRVESAPTPGQVIMIHGRRPNHILHLLLTVVTGGLWAIVWLCVAAGTKETRTILTVNPDGSITDSMRPVPRPAGAPATPWYKQPLVIGLLVIVGLYTLAMIAGAGS